MDAIGLLFLVHYLSAGQLTQRKPPPNILPAGAVYTRFFLLNIDSKKRKKKTKLGRACAPPGKKTTA